jgi:hypothetical protein
MRISLYQAYESLTAELFEELRAGFRETSECVVGRGPKNRIAGGSGHRHQIDVSLKDAGSRRLLLVECKHVRAPVSTAPVLTLQGRIIDIGKRFMGWTIHGAIVSPHGATRGAKSLARSFDIELLRVSSAKEYFISYRNNAAIGVADVCGLRVEETAVVEVVGA